MSDRPPISSEPGSERPCGPSDLRCACGSLLARRVGDAVELKCRRCKRTVLIPFETDDAGAQPFAE